MGERDECHEERQILQDLEGVAWGDPTSLRNWSGRTIAGIVRCWSVAPSRSCASCAVSSGASHLYLPPDASGGCASTGQAQLNCRHTTRCSRRQGR
jgi:hypothetical protein